MKSYSSVKMWNILIILTFIFMLFEKYFTYILPSQMLLIVLLLLHIIEDALERPKFLKRQYSAIGHTEASTNSMYVELYQ